MSYYSKPPTGKKYGRWEVLSYGGPGKWLCKCECGTERAVARNSLRKGASTSCGCWRREFLSKSNKTHGRSKTKLYRVWAAMLERCNSVANKQYQSYGGRGITVCSEWEDFAKYSAYVDSLPKPKGVKRLSLDRIDNDGNYEPGNLRWASDESQARNTRQATRRVPYQGELVHPYDVCDAEGLNKRTLKKRIGRGESPEDALQAMRRYREHGPSRADRLQINVNGVTLDVSGWAEVLGVHPGTIRYRLKRVAAPEDAVAHYLRPTNSPTTAGVDQIPQP